MSATFYMHVGTNLVALALLAVCFRWPRAGRVLFVLMFAAAGLFNLHAACTRPQVYLAFADLTPLPLYARFVRGPFARQPGLLVGAIAAGQLLVALLTALPGQARRLGLCGAVVFLVAIAPLGTGSAFPSTLIMAAGAGVLLRRGD